MAYPYDQGRRQRGRQEVPLELAESLARERNELREEVLRLRRENQQLREDARNLREEGAVWKQRVVEAEDIAGELRAELEERLEATPQSMSGEEELRRITRLSRRVEELGADLERVQRRSEEAVRQARREERGRLLNGMGEILDSVERGLENLEEGPWKAGLEGIREQLLGFLRAQGAKVIGEVGEGLDPRRHQALAMVEKSEAASGEVVQVARYGIELEDGTVVRPAQVLVAR